MMNRYRDAIASIESAGSGGYSAIGPTHPSLGRALGRYQVMEANIGPWSREALGREVTPDEFINNPEIQDAIFDSKFGGYVNQFGPEGAAQAWFAGPGGVGKTSRQDSLGTNVGQYAQKFRNALGASQGGGQMTPNSRQPQPGMPQQANPVMSTQGQAPDPDQERERIGGFVGKMFPNLTRDSLDRISLALMSMSSYPTPGMEYMMQGAAQRIGDRREEGKAAQQRNKTAEWLRSNGMPQLADGVETGSITAKDALVLARQQPKDDRTALMKNAQWIMSQNPDMSFDEALQAARSGQTINVNNNPTTKGEETLDKELAKDLNTFIQGGAADMSKNLSQLKGVRDRLAGEDAPNVSGPLVGSMPDALSAVVNPEAVDVREQVEEVVQRNLREVLGAQFTEKEGERLIKRAWNPMLDEQTNIARLDRLIKQIELAYQTKAEAAQYFRENGTLKGWQGKLPSINDFSATIGDPESNGTPSDEELLQKYGG